MSTNNDFLIKIDQIIIINRQMMLNNSVKCMTHLRNSINDSCLFRREVGISYSHAHNKNNKTA